PSNKPFASDAERLLQRLLSSKDFASSVARIRPYFGLILLEIDLRERDYFLDNYLSNLLLNPGSVLYREIRESQNSDGCSYAVPKFNKILDHLFNDARVAERLHVWRPIGETIIRELDRLKRYPSEDAYNRVADREFQDEEQWESPLVAGVFLFDLMVTKA